MQVRPQTNLKPLMAANTFIDTGYKGGSCLMKRSPCVTFRQAFLLTLSANKIWPRCDHDKNPEVKVHPNFYPVPVCPKSAEDEPKIQAQDSNGASAGPALLSGSPACRCIKELIRLIPDRPCPTLQNFPSLLTLPAYECPAISELLMLHRASSGFAPSGRRCSEPPPTSSIVKPPPAIISRSPPWSVATDCRPNHGKSGSLSGAITRPIRNMLTGRLDGSSKTAKARSPATSEMFPWLMHSTNARL